MIQTTVEFKGLRELDEALKVLPFEVQKKVLRKGLRQAGEVLRNAMESLAPRAFIHRVKRGGKDWPTPLSDSIVFRVRFAKDGDPVAEIGPSKRAFWGMWQELGTKTMAAQPFMRKAMDRDGQIAVAAFATGAKDELEAVVRRLRRNAREG